MIFNIMNYKNKFSLFSKDSLNKIIMGIIDNNNWELEMIKKNFFLKLYSQI